jgi:hypothetical protein
VPEKNMILAMLDKNLDEEFVTINNSYYFAVALNINWIVLIICLGFETIAKQIVNRRL